MSHAVLLRAMINWCIEDPVREQPLAADDLELRARRKSKSLDYGWH